MKITAIGCILMLCATGALADNLLVNADFETGDLTGWVASGESALSTISVLSGDNGLLYPGTHSAFLSNEAQAIGLNLKQSTELGLAIAGAVNYSFDMKLDQADVGGVLFVEIFAEQEGVGIVGGSGLMGPFWPWGAWETFEGSFVAPANTDFLTIQFVATTGATEGSNCIAHVDNVVLDQGTVAAEAMTWSGVKSLYR